MRNAILTLALAMPEGLILSIQGELFVGRFRVAEGHEQILVSPPAATLGFARQEAIDEHAQRLTLAASSTDRLIHQPAAAPEAGIHEPVIQLRRHPRRQKRAACGDSAGKVRAIMVGQHHEWQR